MNKVMALRGSAHIERCKAVAIEKIHLTKEQYVLILDRCREFKETFGFRPSSYSRDVLPLILKHFGTKKEYDKYVSLIGGVQRYRRSIREYQEAEKKFDHSQKLAVLKNILHMSPSQFAIFSEKLNKIENKDE